MQYQPTKNIAADGDTGDITGNNPVNQNTNCREQSDDKEKEQTRSQTVTPQGRFGWQPMHEKRDRGKKR